MDKKVISYILEKTPTQQELEHKQESKSRYLQALNLNEVLEYIDVHDYNWSDILADQVIKYHKDKSVVNVDMDKLKNYIYQVQPIRVKSSKYVRDDNAEGILPYTQNINEQHLWGYTSNGTQEVLRLIDRLAKQHSDRLSKVVSEAVGLAINEAVDEKTYYKSNNGVYSKKVIDTDLDKICKAYMDLQKGSRNLKTCLKFLDVTDGRIKNSEYRLVKHIILEDYLDELKIEDVNKVCRFIVGRCDRIQSQFEQVGLSELKVNAYKTKYNKELTDYINVFKQFAKDNKFSVLSNTEKECRDLRKLINNKAYLKICVDRAPIK